MRNNCKFKLLTRTTLWLWLVSLPGGCTGDYLELEDFNERELVESCPTTACEARNNSCSEMEFTSCSDILCVDACSNSQFNDSQVVCEKASSCANTLFESSQVVCNQSNACIGATFINSAVKCQPSAGESYLACDQTLWLDCSCCLNYNNIYGCPYEIPSCFDNVNAEEGSTDNFCARTLLGRTCKDWGNPICKDSSVESIPPIHPANECSAGQDIVECGLYQSCQGIDLFSSCSVNCIGNQACNSTRFDQSTVACQAPSSCLLSTFTNSEVTCTAEESCAVTIFSRSTAHCNVSSACYYALFIGSAVDCVTGGACQDIYHQCSCCLTPEECPSGMSQCGSDDVSREHFCNNTFLGQTCKDWGNPACADSIVSSHQPLHPASTCSENVDVLECLGDCSRSSPLAIDSCTVFCLFDCYNSFSFDNSTVYCYGGVACDFATFRGSEVECSNDGCWYVDFKSSAVNCSNDFDTCMGATLDGCSCCMNSESCPDGGDLCFDETGSSDDFCRQIHDDQRCQNTPNPICKDYIPTLAPSPNQQSLTTTMDTPINIEAPSPTNITKVSISRNPKNGQLTIHTNNTVTYTPNTGFVGFDDFSIEFCYTDSHCDTMNVEVEVTSVQSTLPTVSAVPTVPADDEENDTSKGLYALSALALIPLIIVSVFVGKRYRQSTRSSVAVDSSNPSPDHLPTNSADVPVPSPDPSALCQTTAVIGLEVSTSVSDDASRQSSLGGVSHSTGGVSQRQRQSPPGIECYKLSNKDQCRTHISENIDLPVADALPME